MQQLFEQSQQAIKAQAQGGYQPDKVDHTVPSVEINNMCCNFILVSDPVTDVKRKLNQPQYEILTTFFHKFHSYPNDIPLRIVGRIVLISHHWQEVTLVNKAKRRLHCTHHSSQCECAQFALRNITRPYKDFPIFKPYLRNRRFALANKSDKRMLSQIGFFWSALICADLKSKVHDLGLDKYT